MNHLKWTSTLIDALCRQGVRHAVISPGSRSTPLTMAVAMHPLIQKHVVLDERSAAFIALGIGKRSGIPAVLICTSGTAVANYYPSVIEAKESGVPMIILSADRPPNLRNIGSSQTIDQIKIFGDQVAFFHEAGEPREQDPSSDLERIAYLARQAVENSISPGGAAHINLPFRKPLEPSGEQLLTQQKSFADRTDAPDIRHPAATSDIRLSDEIYDLIASSQKPVLLAGPSNPHHCLIEQTLELADRLKAPVLAEPGSGVVAPENLINRYEQILRSDENLESLRPDLILRFGDQPFTKSLLNALKEWKKTPVIHFDSRRAWQDHAMSIRHRIECRKHDRLNLTPAPAVTGSLWLSKWRDLDAGAEAQLQSELSKTDALTDGHVFSHISSQLAQGWNMMLSNSFPARDMALFGKPAARQFVNRGAAGIDGISSTALGIHLASHLPTCCITGDLAFLHDSNALLSVSKKEKPFVIIVVNNGGGTIFRMLPVFERNEISGTWPEMFPANAPDRLEQSDLYTAYFETPQDADIQQLARACGLESRKIASLAELKQLDLNSVKDPVVIECVTDTAKSMEIRKTLWGSNSK